MMLKCKLPIKKQATFICNSDGLMHAGHLSCGAACQGTATGAVRGCRKGHGAGTILPGEIITWTPDEQSHRGIHFVCLDLLACSCSGTSARCTLRVRNVWVLANLIDILGGFLWDTGGSATSARNLAEPESFESNFNALASISCSISANL